MAEKIIITMDNEADDDWLKHTKAGIEEHGVTLISNMMMAAATEALSELNEARMGIVTRKSHCFLTRGRIPLPSLPITTQIGPENSVA